MITPPALAPRSPDTLMCEVRRRGLAPDSCLVARGMRDHSTYNKWQGPKLFDQSSRDGVIIEESRMLPSGDLDPT